MHDYGHSDLSVLFYHISDSYQTTDTMARKSFYGVYGTPWAVFGGTRTEIGGLPYGSMRAYYEPHITYLLGVSPYVSIDMSGSSIDATGGTVNIQLEALKDVVYSNCKIQVVIYEDDVISGEGFMVRDILPTDDLTALNVGETQTLVKTFEIDPAGEPWPGAVNPENVGVVVFVQSNTSKNILNSTTLSKVDVEITPETASVPMGTDLLVTAHLTNITPWTQSVTAWLDALLPSGNEIPGNPFMGPVNVNIPGGAVIDQDLTVSVPDNIPAVDYGLRLGVGDQANSNDTWEYDKMTVTVTP